LVERVEGFCSTADWKRGYSEINDFELQLSRNNMIVIKFWLAISEAEQLKRFRDREATSFKQFKITKEDWRNRKRWKDYELAICEMVDQTSSDISPWHIVEANDKYFCRLKVLRILCETIEKHLKDL
jgi:polyphosphate kinase 2 (PPK2 family)